MANNDNALYDAQLEKLIDLALMDGVLTDKERQILIKKATQLGIDPDEFEMVLDARLYARKQELAVAPPKTTSKRRKDEEDDEDYEEDEDEDEDEDDDEDEEDEDNYEEDEEYDGDDDNAMSSLYSNPNERVYTASRLSKDHKMFPPTVVFNEQGVLVKLPAFLRKTEDFIPYSAISGVGIETPLVGFSRIYFRGLGSAYNLTGFKKSEVIEMKRIIERSGI